MTERDGVTMESKPLLWIDDTSTPLDPCFDVCVGDGDDREWVNSFAERWKAEQLIRLINAYVIPPAVARALEEETKVLRETLEAVESEVSKVYCNITNGRLSKVNYKADVVISAAEEEMDKTVMEAVKEAEGRIWEECARFVEDHYWDTCGKVGEAHGKEIASSLRSKKAGSSEPIKGYCKETDCESH